MNSVILLVIMALAINNAFAAKDQPSNENAAKEIGKQGREKLKITDLNLDVFFIIYDYLEESPLEHLLNCSEVNSKLALFAAEIFRQRYHKISIVNAYYTDRYDVSRYIECPGKYLEIFNFDIIKRTLKQFGCVLKGCSVQAHNVKPDRAPIVNEHINKYGCNSLTYLNLGSIREDTLEKFTLPFTQLETLSIQISSELKQFRTGNWTINQMFPNLNRLVIFFDSSADYSFFVEEIPNLDDLYVAISDFSRRDQIEEFLKKNSRVRTMEVQYSPEGFVEMIEKWMPNVVNLTLRHIKNDTAHFEHVRNLEIIKYEKCHIERLSFSNLESLQMRYAPVNFESWIQFFQNHKNISRLKLYQWHEEKVVPLMELTAELSNLVEVEFESSSPMNVDTIIQFIERQEKLIKFQFTVKQFEEGNLIILRERFQNEWHIEDAADNEWKGLLFERKMN